jgi:predicted nucleotidyltransferase
MAVSFPQEPLIEFCRRYQVRRLALFGSALRDDFHPDSDVDVLVEFPAGIKHGLFTLGVMQMELSALLGREVDLKTAGFLHPRFRQRVIGEAETIYEA